MKCKRSYLYLRFGGACPDSRRRIEVVSRRFILGFRENANKFGIPRPKESPNTSAETAPLVERGDRLFGVGDIASARLFYERAADAGDGQAALRLGETYDPAFLERAQLRVQGDRALAVFWYRRARELGASEAEILLKGAQAR
jgi:hypothetical protein